MTQPGFEIRPARGRLDLPWAGSSQTLPALLAGDFSNFLHLRPMNIKKSSDWQAVFFIGQVTYRRYLPCGRQVENLTSNPGYDDVKVTQFIHTK